MAAIFCILCFILLFAIVIVNVMETQYDDPEYNHPAESDGFDEEMATGKQTNPRYELNAIEKTYCKYTILNKQPILTCTSGDIDNINEDVEQSMKEVMKFF